MNTRHLIEQWAREASGIGDSKELSGDAIERFAQLVARHCAEVCEQQREPDPDLSERGENAAMQLCADIIRKEFGITE